MSTILNKIKSANFWKKLKKPILVLAPMAEVTDPAFRRIIAKYGKPDVLWTEFVSADGLARAPKPGLKKLMADLQFDKTERPIVAQFFTSKPEYMEKAAKLAKKLGFDGVDINMGCPDKSIEKQGAGAMLMKNPELAKELILAAKKGAGGLPVSVKTRIGFNKVEIDTWLPILLEAKPDAITFHLRTRKEMSKVPAQWELMKEIIKIRNASGSKTLILGNGDIKTPEEGRRMCEETGCDGVMIGRGIFGNPWLWSKKVPTPKMKLKVLLEHMKLFKKLLPHKNFNLMKKHFKAYIADFEGAKELRDSLLRKEKPTEMEKEIKQFLKSIS